MSRSRSLAVFGAAITTGILVPNYLMQHPEAIDTGNSDANQVINVILQNTMVVAGLTGFILDNTIPGTRAEKGLDSYHKYDEETLKSTILEVLWRPMICHMVCRISASGNGHVIFQVVQRSYKIVTNLVVMRISKIVHLVITFKLSILD